MNRNRHKSFKTAAVILSLLMLVALAGGGTVAFLTSQTAEVKNTFSLAKVTCVVDETFDGTEKSEIKVQNTSDIEAYLRVKLITYLVDIDGNRVGGTATIDMPATLGDGWVQYTDTNTRNVYYYYTLPVAPNAYTSDLTGAGTITLTTVDGNNQVIEVMAEAIQATPAAVAEAWPGVTVVNGTLTINN